MRKRRARILSASFGGLCVLALARHMEGQVDTGAISGTVRDQSGAVIPRAKVTLTNEGTAFQASTLAASDGAYIFNPLKIGTYPITTASSGFEQLTHVHVKVDIQRHVVVDFKLYTAPLRKPFR